MGYFFKRWRKECWRFYWAVNALFTYYLWSFSTFWQLDMFKWKNFFSFTLEERGHRLDLTWSSRWLVSFCKVFPAEFDAFCCFGIVLLQINKQECKIQDLDLECDAYFPWAFLEMPWKGQHSLWYKNYPISKFASDRTSEAKFFTSSSHISGWYFEFETSFLTMMTLGWCLLNFIFQFWGACKKWLKGSKSTWFMYFWQHFQIFWCSLTDNA